MPLLDSISCRKRPRDSDTTTKNSPESSRMYISASIPEDDGSDVVNFSPCKKKKPSCAIHSNCLQETNANHSYSFRRQSSPIIRDDTEMGKADEAHEAYETYATDESSSESTKLTIPTIIISFCDKLASKMAAGTIGYISGIKNGRSLSEGSNMSADDNETE